MISENQQHRPFPRKPGRPSKLTPEVIQIIVEAVRAGNYLETAAECAGVAAFTVRRWMKRGKDREGPHGEFCAAIKKAMAQSEVEALAEISSGEGNWQSRAWKLERRFPKRWGRKAMIPPKPPKEQPERSLEEIIFRAEHILAASESP